MANCMVRISHSTETTSVCSPELWFPKIKVGSGGRSSDPSVLDILKVNFGDTVAVAQYDMYIYIVFVIYLVYSKNLVSMIYVVVCC